MDKEYLTIDGELAMVDGKLIGVEASANVSDVVDEQTTYVAQSQSLTNEIEELLVNGVIDGSPKGVYANLSALQTAYPNGASGVYLTSDNGHWYYYNNGWKDGGVYRESSDRFTILWSGNWTNSNTDVKSINFTGYKYIIVRGNVGGSFSVMLPVVNSTYGFTLIAGSNRNTIFAFNLSITGTSIAWGVAGFYTDGVWQDRTNTGYYNIYEIIGVK